MPDWFTIEAIDSDTFVISEYKHWEEMHSYLLCGTDTALLIDTGLGISNIRDVVVCLTSLPIIVATTHAHWDHIGGHALFEHFSIHEQEVSWITGKFPLPLEIVKRNLLRPPCTFPPDFHIDHYQIFNGEPSAVLRDLGLIDIGNRRITVLHTPGHSPGHCCFYEESRQYLFSGDLIYKGCLDAFYPTTDPQQFFQSVARVDSLPVKRVLPAHHQLDIPVSLIHDIYQGFDSLCTDGKLRQGAGIFEFGNFQIHL